MRLNLFLSVVCFLLISCGSEPNPDNMNPSNGTEISGQYELVNFNFTYTNMSEIMGSQLTTVVTGNSVNEIVSLEVADSTYEISGIYDIDMVHEFSGNMERVSYDDIDITGSYSLDLDSISSSTGFYKVMDQFVADNMFTDSQKCAWRFEGNRLKLECAKYSFTSQNGASSEVELLSNSTWVMR